MVKRLGSVHQVGRELAEMGLVERSPSGAYMQTDENCYEIAAHLAKKAGFSTPTRKDIGNYLFDQRAEKMGWQTLPRVRNSPVSLVLRTGDNPTDVHVALEVSGMEYNFGPANEDDYKIETRMSLRKGI